MAESEVHRIRRDFPILNQTINDAALVYLDNAATSHKPLSVINALQQFYSADNSNIHRGVHTLSERATEEYERARNRIRRFINARKSEEIVFVRGVTEAVNLVAAGFGRKVVSAGDEIIITEMEHHSNIVPWQMLCDEQGALLKVVPVDDNGDLRLDQFETLLTERTRLVALTHVSNVLGTVNPLREIIELAHAEMSLSLLTARRPRLILKWMSRSWAATSMLFRGIRFMALQELACSMARPTAFEKCFLTRPAAGRSTRSRFRRPVSSNRPRSSRRGRPISQARLA